MERIHYLREGARYEVAVGSDDLVFVTNGSMTAASSLGTMSSPPTLGTKAEGGSWALWEALAKDHTDFGRPSAFNGNVSESKRPSFTATLRDPTFLRFMEEFTSNKAGTGGLVTLTDFNWLMSAVVPYQPHFINQPDGIYVFWSYGLFPDQEGNFVKKKMSDGTGEELLVEASVPPALR